MGIVHFLDVGQGDCTVIQHPSGRVSMIDVCKARKTPAPKASEQLSSLLPPQNSFLSGLAGNNPPTKASDFLSQLAALSRDSHTGNTSEGVNPIEYMQRRDIREVFRFILTHPDMDHMDGIKDLFETFNPVNFWDTENNEVKEFSAGSPFRKEDWEYYLKLRAGLGPKRLANHSGDRGSFYNDGEIHDGLHILSPTTELIATANKNGDFNDASYVILYRTSAGRILFCGDSHDKTWEHILANHLPEIENVEVMIAPHHGRDSGRNREFLTLVRPKLSILGRASSDHLMYDAWNNRGLDFITAHQAGTIILDADGDHIIVYAANEGFAKRIYNRTFFDPNIGGWYLGYVR